MPPTTPVVQPDDVPVDGGIDAGVETSLDHVFSALGHPARRAIVTRLGRGEATVKQLAEPFDMSLPAVSKHLLVLERAGMISRTRVGRSRRCRLITSGLRAAEAWFASRSEFWTDTLDSFAAFVESPAAAEATEAEDD